MVTGLAFELLRFATGRVSEDVAVLELEGRFRAGAPARLGRPTLVAEAGASGFEAPAIGAAEATAGPGGPSWHASFALPAPLAGGARFALNVGGELLIELPAPDRGLGGGGEAAEHHVRLAREANALRRRAEGAEGALAAAQARAERAEAAARGAEARAAEAHQAIAAARAEAHQEVAATRERAEEERRARELAQAETVDLRAELERERAEAAWARERTPGAGRPAAAWLARALALAAIALVALALVLVLKPG